MEPLKVSYLRSRSGIWIASVASLKGCRAEGTTIIAARRALRKVLAARKDLPPRESGEPEAELIEEIGDLPQVQAALAARRAAGRELLIANREMDLATRRAVRLLIDRMGLSFRDAAALLRLSPGRVFQIARGERARKGLADGRLAAARVAAWKPKRR